MDRSFERDIIPMARSMGMFLSLFKISKLIRPRTGMALAPWSVLARGKLRTDEEEERRRASGENGRTLTGSWERNENEVKMSHALVKVAKEIGAKSISAGTLVV